MTYMQLAIAEAKARAAGNEEQANIFQRLRWELAMGLIINTENTRPQKQKPKA